MKAKRTVAILGGVITVITAMVTGAIYRFTFFFSEKQRKNIRFPEGEQYQPHLESSKKLIEKLKALPYEEVQILSEDGLKLFGKYYHQADGVPLEILFHGYHGVAERDFCGGFWLAREAGHNVLLIDERAHGKSEGNVISFGIKERYDCLAWTHYAEERFGKETKIVLVGVSMGAATVLMAANLDLPENVKGIIADCGYSSPEAIVRKVAGDMGLPVRLLYPLARLSARVFGHFDLEEASAVEALEESKIPVLFIHGEDDRFVPCEMSRENYDACASDKVIFTVPGAGHTLCYMVDNEGYQKAVNEFLEKIDCKI